MRSNNSGRNAGSSLPPRDEVLSRIDHTVRLLRDEFGEGSRSEGAAVAPSPALSEAIRQWPTLYPQWTGLMEEYDSARFGPLLGVSDEGSAGKAIADAAYGSPKARATSGANAMTAGVIIDGERMTSAGEVPIGPDEYSDVVAAAFGRTLCTTNVGVRANARLYQIQPEFEAADEPAQVAANIFARFEPFIRTPDLKPRPLTVRLLLRPGWDETRIAAVIQEVEAGRAAGKLKAADIHQVSLLLVFDGEIGQGDEAEIARTLRFAERLGLKQVAIDGEVLEGSRRRLSVPALLNVLTPEAANRVLSDAQDLEVVLRYRYAIDIGSVARTIWTGLHTARTFGLTAAKFGLVPLTLEEQEAVTARIMSWTSGWTAIPAFYVDTPLVTETAVYGTDRSREAAVLWLDTMKKVGVRVVLFDSPDRVAPRRLLKDDAADARGVLTFDDVRAILQHANDAGILVLWSGGITLRQVVELASLGVFGIFTTSSTASPIAVTREFFDDPVLAAENEPTEMGVRRVLALIQAGFLSGRPSTADPLKQQLRTEAAALIAANTAGQPQALEALERTLLQVWTSFQASGVR